MSDLNEEVILVVMKRTGRRGLRFRLTLVVPGSHQGRQTGGLGRKGGGNHHGDLVGGAQGYRGA